MDHRHTFLTTQGREGPPRMSDQPDAGAESEIAQTWKTIHIKHTPIHTNKANMEWWLRRPNDLGPCGPKVSWHLSYRWGKAPKKPPQETCPDRGSNPGPLRDKRACYHLLHSRGLILVFPVYMSWLVYCRNRKPNWDLWITLYNRYLVSGQLWFIY